MTATKTKSGTKFKKHEAIVMAAVLAHCNMGQFTPARQDVQRLLQNEQVTLSSAVVYISGDLMETDEHQRAFEEEAANWLRDISKSTVEKETATHPDLYVELFHKENPVYWSSPVPEKDDFGDVIRGSFVDGRTKSGPWATMSLDSFKKWGVGVGQGAGQRYVRVRGTRWLKVEG